MTQFKDPKHNALTHICLNSVEHELKITGGCPEVTTDLVQYHVFEANQMKNKKHRKREREREGSAMSVTSIYP